MFDEHIVQNKEQGLCLCLCDDTGDTSFQSCEKPPATLGCVLNVMPLLSNSFHIGTTSQMFFIFPHFFLNFYADDGMGVGLQVERMGRVCLFSCHPDQQRNWPGIEVSVEQSYEWLRMDRMTRQL
jgi:hypothetical protein